MTKAKPLDVGMYNPFRGKTKHLPAVIDGKNENSISNSKEIHKVRKKLEIARGEKERLLQQRDRVLNRITRDKNTLVRENKLAMGKDVVFGVIFLAGLVDLTLNPFDLVGDGHGVLGLVAISVSTMRWLYNFLERDLRGDSMKRKISKKQIEIDNAEDNHQAISDREDQTIRLLEVDLNHLESGGSLDSN